MKLSVGLNSTILFFPPIPQFFFSRPAFYLLPFRVRSAKKAALLAFSFAVGN